MLWSCGLWQCLISWIVTSVSEEPVAPIFRIYTKRKLLPKRQHDVITQKITIQIFKVDCDNVMLSCGQSSINTLGSLDRIDLHLASIRPEENGGERY
jgi:hypothetical protein